MGYGVHAEHIHVVLRRGRDVRVNRRPFAVACAVDLYRPHDYKEFPPSRFRMQYVFEEGGSARWFYLAPDDGHHFKPGTWRLDHDEEDVIVVDQGGRIVSYRVLELTRHLLRMMRIDIQETGAR